MIWKYTDDDGAVGVLGPLYTEEADPGTTNFIPRPDWFFYFLFYLLRIFKWPETVVLGTVGVPTLLLVLLITLPFYDRRPERAVLRRPVAFVAAILVVISMGVLTWKGATAKEGSEAVGEVPTWAEEQGFADNPVAVEGRDALRGVRLPQLPRLSRRRWPEPRRAGPERGRAEGPRHRMAGRAPQEPEQQGARIADAVVRDPRRREPDEDRDLPRGLEGAAGVESRQGRRQASACRRGSLVYPLS